MAGRCGSVAPVSERRGAINKEGPVLIPPVTPYPGPGDMYCGVLARAPARPLGGARAGECAVGRPGDKYCGVLGPIRAGCPRRPGHMARGVLGRELAGRHKVLRAVLEVLAGGARVLLITCRGRGTHVIPRGRSKRHEVVWVGDLSGFPRLQPPPLLLGRKWADWDWSRTVIDRPALPAAVARFPHAGMRGSTLATGRYHNLRDIGLDGSHGLEVATYIAPLSLSLRSSWWYRSLPHD